MRSGLDGGPRAPLSSRLRSSRRLQSGSRWHTFGTFRVRLSQAGASPSSSRMRVVCSRITGCGWQQIVECYSTVLCGCGRLDKCGLDSRVGGQTIKLRAIFLGFKADRLGIHRRRRPFVVWREFWWKFCVQLASTHTNTHTHAHSQSERRRSHRFDVCLLRKCCCCCGWRKSVVSSTSQGCCTEQLPSRGEFRPWHCCHYVKDSKISTEIKKWLNKLHFSFIWNHYYSNISIQQIPVKNLFKKT